MALSCLHGSIDMVRIDASGLCVMQPSLPIAHAVPVVDHVLRRIARIGHFARSIDALRLEVSRAVMP